AQDLNTQQYRLLNGLPVPQRLFVGDPYQSIYGWRQADYRLFRGLADKGPRCDLNENHRSAKGILDFVQLLFGRIWGNDKAFIPMVKPG
ncbi:UvrD-helicase domain-containing protein, partial [Vibrio parahaemolyticus]